MNGSIYLRLFSVKSNNLLVEYACTHFIFSFILFSCDCFEALSNELITIAHMNTYSCDDAFYKCKHSSTAKTLKRQIKKIKNKCKILKKEYRILRETKNLNIVYQSTYMSMGKMISTDANTTKQESKIYIFSNTNQFTWERLMILFSKHTCIE